MEKINVDKLKELSNKKESNKEISLRPAGDDNATKSLSVTERIGDSVVSIFAVLKNENLHNIRKRIETPEEEEFSTYYPQGTLKMRIKKPWKKTVESSIGAIDVDPAYWGTVECFDESGVRSLYIEYDAHFRFDLPNVIKFIEENGFKNASVKRIYLNDSLDADRRLHDILLAQNIIVNYMSPYWVITYAGYKNENGYTVAISTYLDGVTGAIFQTVEETPVKTKVN